MNADEKEQNVKMTYPGKKPFTTEGPNERAGFIPAPVHPTLARCPIKSANPIATGARNVLEE
jgi:hypothetical protein